MTDLTEIKNKISVILAKNPHFSKSSLHLESAFAIARKCSTPWNKTFHPLEQNVPSLGTKPSRPWNKLFHPLEAPIPKPGTNACSPCAATARNAVFSKMAVFGPPKRTFLVKKCKIYHIYHPICHP
ncbi:MAG: hypothetical protein IJ588_14015 [Prevotella sp.]|nr:hypothetical protein [Prevotella sp.]